MSNCETRYSKAIELYRTTNMSISEICKLTDTSMPAFKSYVQLHHRNLMFARHGLSVAPGEEAKCRLRKPKGQTATAHAKYKEAILACDDVRYIELNVSEIARLFNLDPSGLGNQLRNHFPDLLARRAKERRRRGINDNHHRGARPVCRDKYAKAVEHLRSTDDTISQTAEAHGVSYAGLREHIINYHKDLTTMRSDRRAEAVGTKTHGALTGNGRRHLPNGGESEKYARAIELYRSSPLTIKDIALESGVKRAGLTYHIRAWHSNLVNERYGLKDNVTLRSDAKLYRKSTAAKYSEAIRILRESGRSTADVARDLGFNPDVLRRYLHEHEPALAATLGMTRLENGKVAGKRSKDKYGDAIRLYETTGESLKSIAERLGLVYKSISCFIRRNCPEVIDRHNAVAKACAGRLDGKVCQ